MTKLIKSIFGLAGVALYCILANFGFLASITAYATAILCLKGWNFGGYTLTSKSAKLLISIIIFEIIFAFFLSLYITFIMEIIGFASSMNENISFTLIFWLNSIWYYFTLLFSTNILIESWFDILITIIFSWLGINNTLKLIKEQVST
jgi:hypothetical protein